MALTLRRDVEPISPPTDDYLVEGEEESNRPTAGAQVVRVLQILLILVLAALSLAVFWVLGLLFNIF
jgi:hypothetical protein